MYLLIKSKINKSNEYKDKKIRFAVILWLMFVCLFV